MTAPVFLVPADPLDPRAPDQHFAREADAARRVGLTVMVIDHGAVVAGEDRLAVRRVAASEGVRPGWYRGWMLRADEYARLAAALEARGVRLLTDPSAYRTAHELPGWYAAFADVTPQSVWMSWTAGRTPTAGEVGALVADLGGGPGVVKDYVKSRKHEWDEACFVPDLSDAAAAAGVVARMVALQGDDLAGGIVARAFEEFVSDDDGRVPEARAWWVAGAPVLVTPHPDAPAGTTVEVPAEVIDGVGACIGALGAPFVTTDLALRSDGVWRVIEVGDGQVSDLPADQEPEGLMGALAAAG
jgi:hypothetical protein